MVGAHDPACSPRRCSTFVRAEAVIYVKDLERMCSFYERCVGLAVGDTAEDYAVLESDLWRLSLVLIPASVAATIQLSVPARRRETAAIKLGFPVARIVDLRSPAAVLGGQIDPASTQWDFLGFRRCDAIDPEGNVIQLLEPLASETPAR
jgi:predicted enzyme related to lactoylglutathione lyase